MISQSLGSNPPPASSSPTTNYEKNCPMFYELGRPWRAHCRVPISTLFCSSHSPLFLILVPPCATEVTRGVPTSGPGSSPRQHTPTLFYLASLCPSPAATMQRHASHYYPSLAGPEPTSLDHVQVADSLASLLLGDLAPGWPSSYLYGSAKPSREPCVQQLWPGLGHPQETQSRERTCFFGTHREAYDRVETWAETGFSTPQLFLFLFFLWR